MAGVILFVGLLEVSIAGSMPVVSLLSVIRYAPIFFHTWFYVYAWFYVILPGTYDELFQTESIINIMERNS